MNDDKEQMIDCLCFLLGRATILLNDMAETFNQKSKVSALMKQVDSVVYQGKSDINQLIGEV